MSSDPLAGHENLPPEGLPAGPVDVRGPRSFRETLAAVGGRLDAALPPERFFKTLACGVGYALTTKVGVVGRQADGEWRLVVESYERPPIPLGASDVQLGALTRVTTGLSPRVELWPAGGHEWTLLSLSPSPPVVLVLEGDWTAEAQTLCEFAAKLTRASKHQNGSQVPSGNPEYQLARTLADTIGLAAVSDAILAHTVRAVPSGIASLAVATAEGDLRITASHGYPRALVEHLRIASGSGVIGSVHASKSPLLVPEVSAAGLDRQRSRYRTQAFAAVPIVAGGDCLGVLSLTDRALKGPYTLHDLAALEILLAPAALALGRERVLQEAQAYAQAAVIDPVSGLFNRRYFQARLDEELHRAVRQLTSVALLMVDLDGFKSINDRFGHVAGDVVIRDISEILRRSVRIFDVCTRFGGEEFAVMMPGGTVESAVTIAERIRERVESYRRSEPELTELKVTASIGVAVSPPGVTARDLIERADRALYRAKKGGKNQVSTAPLDGSR